MNILAVDDESLMLDNYEMMLRDEGHQLTCVADAVAATERLRHQTWDLVLLDQNLLGGPGGGSDGLELIDSIRTYSPAGRIFVVSGAPDLMIRRAFELGVDDYLVKDRHLRQMLLTKIGVVAQFMQARRQQNCNPVEREERLQQTWRQLQDESDIHRKGHMLEDLIVDLFLGIAGVRDAIARVRNDIEEIDVQVITNGTGLWAAFQQYPTVVVECKKWSATVGRDELDILAAKIRRRHGLARLGFFIAWSGVSKPFEKLATMDKDHLIVILDQTRLKTLLATTERAEQLQRWIDAAIVDVHR